MSTTTTSIEEWMHASDEERKAILSNWNIDSMEGKDIADEVAHLFSKECVYNIDEVGVIKKDGKWFIDAYVVVDDYDSLKDRTNVEFLGFGVVFNSMANYAS